MPQYEYKVVPAPKKPGKIKGVKGTDNKFAGSLAALMNEFGAEGWEYQRTDTLPCEERQGLRGRTTVFQNMLIFRRKIGSDAPETAPVEQPRSVSEPMLAVPTFRTAPPAPAAPAAIAAAPEGQAPRLGAAPELAAQ